MSATLRQVPFESWDAYELANDKLRAIIVPQLGGKIVSLKSQRTGREWLWRNPHLPLQTPAKDATDYGVHDFGGWDEVFPTVSPCELPGTAWGESTITDHGELWRQPWAVTEESANDDGSATLSLYCQLTEFGVVFARRITLANGSNKLTLDYTAENRAPFPAPYIWAAHPLIAIRPGDTWSLPEGTHMQLGVAVGQEQAPVSALFKWPQLPLQSGEGLDLRRLPDASASYALKLFAFDTPSMSLSSAKGERLTFSIEKHHASHIALWLNYGGWSGADCPHYFNAGFEPTNAAYDSLADAARDGHAAVLSPDDAHHWRLVVEAT